MKQNNFVQLLIPDISQDVTIWVSIANIVYIESLEDESMTKLHINEGNTLVERIALIKMSVLLNLVNNITEPRTWE